MQHQNALFLDVDDGFFEADAGGAFGITIVPEARKPNVSPFQLYFALADEPMQAIALIDDAIEQLVKVRTRAVRKAAAK